MKKNTNNKKENTPLITRKQALKKAGIGALTAATVMFLTTKQSSAQSSLPDDLGNGW